MAVALTVAVLVLYRWGERACSELDRLEDYEAVHVMASYEPLGLAEEWGYDDAAGGAS